MWAEGFVDTFMELEEKYGPVTDADGQQAAEQEQVHPPPLHVWDGNISETHQGGCGNIFNNNKNRKTISLSALVSSIKNKGSVMGTLPRGRQLLGFEVVSKVSKSDSNLYDHCQRRMRCSCSAAALSVKEPLRATHSLLFRHARASACAFNHFASPRLRFALRFCKHSD